VPEQIVAQVLRFLESSWSVSVCDAKPVVRQNWIHDPRPDLKSAGTLYELGRWVIQGKRITRDYLPRRMNEIGEST
jgi:hypothetical protein